MPWLDIAWLPLVVVEIAFNLKRVTQFNSFARLSVSTFLFDCTRGNCNKRNPWCTGNIYVGVCITCSLPSRIMNMNYRCEHERSTPLYIWRNKQRQMKLKLWQAFFQGKRNPFLNVYMTNCILRVSIFSSLFHFILNVSLSFPSFFPGLMYPSQFSLRSGLFTNHRHFNLSANARYVA